MTKSTYVCTLIFFLPDSQTFNPALNSLEQSLNFKKARLGIYTTWKKASYVLLKSLSSIYTTLAKVGLGLHHFAPFKQTVYTFSELWHWAETRMATVIQSMFRSHKHRGPLYYTAIYKGSLVFTGDQTYHNTAVSTDLLCILRKERGGGGKKDDPIKVVYHWALLCQCIFLWLY